MRVRLSHQWPSFSRALGTEWRHSPAPGSAQSAGCWRKDLVWERGKAACESGLVTSFSEQAQKQRRTRGGARGSDLGGKPRGRRGCPGSSRGAWSSWCSFRRCPGGMSRTAATASVPGEGLGVRSCRGAGERNSSRFAHGAAWTLSSRSEGQRCWLDISLADLDLYRVTNLGDPTRLIAAPRRFSDCPSLNLEALRAQRAAMLQGPAARAVLVRALGCSGVQKRSSSSAGCDAGAHWTGSPRLRQWRGVGVRSCSRLLGSHLSLSPWSSSSGLWWGWSWTRDPTPTLRWCKPGCLGQRRAL